MKKHFLFFLFASFSALGQSVFKSSEVDQAADPSGGAVTLNKFITANLQIPIRSAAKGLNGSVVVKGIVEPNGSMTGLEVTRSLDSLCDAEALRLFGLYKAWQPAVHKGVVVRQEVTYPVFFRTARLSTFDFATNTIVQYFDKDHALTSDPEKYEYRSLIPVDKRGTVRGAFVYERFRKGTWKTVTTIPFEKKEEWVRLPSDLKPDSVRAFRIVAQEIDRSAGSEIVMVQEDGKLLSIVGTIGDGRLSYMSKHYDKRGMLREEMTMEDSTKYITTWHENGQLYMILESHDKKGVVVHEVYDRKGKQLVKDGNGWAVLLGTPFDFRNVYEQGQVEETRKTGRWTGKHADSTLLFEEFYEHGVLKKGIAFIDGKEVEYQNEFATEAQFPGPDGKMDMYRFMGQNIRYPVEASRNNVTGRVLISFLIHKVGSSSDFKIEQSPDKSLGEEALRVVKLMSGKWQPVMLKGRLVEVRYSLPVNFNVAGSGVTVQTIGIRR